MPAATSPRVAIEAESRAATAEVNQAALVRSGETPEDASAALRNDPLLSNLNAWGENVVPGWGGVWVERKPYRAVVAVKTGDFADAEKLVRAAVDRIGIDVPLTIQPVKRSQRDLLESAKRVGDLLEPDEAVGIDVKANSLRLFVNDPTPKSGQSDRVVAAIARSGINDLSVRYGQSIRPASPGGWDARNQVGCTMSFPLLRPNGTRAILTAGHCSNGSPIWNGTATLGTATEERSWWLVGDNSLRPLDRQVHVDTNASMRFGYLQVPNVTMSDDPILPVSNSSVCRYGATTTAATGATMTCSNFQGYSLQTAATTAGVHVLAMLAGSCLGGDSGGPSWQGSRPVGIHVASSNTAQIDPNGTCFDGLMKDQVAGSGYFTQIGNGGSYPNAIGTYHSYGPNRVFDSRGSGGAFNGTRTASFVSLTNSKIDVSGVVLTVTTVDSTGPGWITATAQGDGPNPTSVLNFRQGTAVSNTVIVRTGTNGNIDFTVNGGQSSNVIIDVVGYISDSSGYEPVDDGSTFTSLTPARIVDSRIGLQKSGPLCGGCTWNAQVVGTGGVPAGAAFAVLNVTVTQTGADGWMTVYAAGSAQPPTSNVNWAVGSTVGRMVVVPIGSGGQVSFVNGSPGSAHLIVDVSGYLLAANANVNSGRTFLTKGWRAYDSRAALAFAANEVRTVNVRGGLTGEGAPSFGVQSVLVNLTMTGMTQPSWFAVYPSGQAFGGTSNVNSDGPDTSNLAWIPVDANGNLDIRNGPGSGHLIVDVVAWSYS